jgi:hypothetical protein
MARVVARGTVRATGGVAVPPASGPWALFQGCRGRRCSGFSRPADRRCRKVHSTTRRRGGPAGSRGPATRPPEARLESDGPPRSAPTWGRCHPAASPAEAASWRPRPRTASGLHRPAPAAARRGPGRDASMRSRRSGAPIPIVVGAVRRGNGSPRSAGRLIAVRGAGGAAVEARNVQREGLDPPRARVARGRREHRARNPGVPEAGQAEAAPVGAGADRPVGADDTAPRPRSVPHARARMRRRRARRVAHQRDNLVPVLQRQHDDQSAG